ncbi:MAG TPA: DUF2934 domain-containing protein [Steroidobacteraceae bacterium]|jgi:hypothetical protein|nr:DUF2934 domain-containing protein [Steroidobacteraceae bacterium]
MPVTSTPNARNTRKATSNKPARKIPSSSAALIDPARRRALIAEAAYFRAERRGFAPGHEAEDWLAAELEVDTALTVGVPSANTPAMQ